MIIALQGMSPKGLLAPIQCDIGHSNRQLGALPLLNRVNRREGATQVGGVDLLLRSAALVSGLCLRDAILNRFQMITTGECTPRTHSVTLHNDIRVEQNGATMLRHDASEIDRMLDAMPHEQLREAFDGQIEQVGHAPD